MPDSEIPVDILENIGEKFNNDYNCTKIIETNTNLANQSRYPLYNSINRGKILTLNSTFNKSDYLKNKR